MKTVSLCSGFPTATVRMRAQGALLGQLTGDALGSQVEFQSPGEILGRYPKGVRELVDGGTWDTLAGQPTDDSEMALALARILVAKDRYDPAAAFVAYVGGRVSGPFDCGGTIAAALRGHPNPDSQANGAMMRSSPLGIFGVNHSLAQVAEWARQDAALTHPNPVCVQANALFVMAIALAVAKGPNPGDLYQQIVAWAESMPSEQALLSAIRKAEKGPPRDCAGADQGWVLIALQNTLWHLAQEHSLEEALVATVMCGGDTDTNGAICGALLGAVQGGDAIPAQWKNAVLSCRPEYGRPGVIRPRPHRFWPVDALDLVDSLLSPPVCIE